MSSLVALNCPKNKVEHLPTGSMPQDATLLDINPNRR